MADVTLEAQTSATPQLIGAFGAAPRIKLAPIVIQRPNDVTPYAVGDVYGAAADARIQIPNAARINGGQITLQMITQVNSSQATKPQFEVWLFNAQPSVAIGDNAPLAGLADADVAALVGRATVSSWPSAQPQAGKLHAINAANVLIFPAAAAGSRDFWAYVAMLNAYTPVANEQLKLTFLTQYQS